MDDKGLKFEVRVTPWYAAPVPWIAFAGTSHQPAWTGDIWPRFAWTWSHPSMAATRMLMKWSARQSSYRRRFDYAVLPSNLAVDRSEASEIADSIVAE